MKMPMRLLRRLGAIHNIHAVAVRSCLLFITRALALIGKAK